MTNEMIIFWESISLMEKGILKGTGRFITVEDKDGGKKELEMPEPIHTFNGWKERGYVVKKGEKSSIKIVIWKYGKKKKDSSNETEEEGRLFMKTAAFFTSAQVMKLA